MNQKHLIVILFTIFIAIATIFVQNSNKLPITNLYSFHQDLESQYQQYLIEFDKNYPTKEEYILRFQIFKKNLDYINKHNQDNSQYQLGINQMSDWTDDEYSLISGKINSQFIQNEIQPKVQVQQSQNKSEIPLNFDWRSQKAVLTAIDQGKSCGGCWAFAVTAALESYLIIATQQRIRLSVQQLIDCSSTDEWGNMGCYGGFVANSFNYMMHNHIVPDYYYQLIVEQKVCNYTALNISQGVKLKQFFRVQAKDVNRLKYALYTYGPVVVSVDAENAVFKSYRGGIINSQLCTQKIGHAVLAIGFGQDENQEEYVIIKNSWGERWGELGFVRISLSQKYGLQGICGVLQDMYVGDGVIFE